MTFNLSISYAQTHGDEGIYWQVNFERFHLHFRDQAIITAVANKLDQVRCTWMLKMYYLKNSHFGKYAYLLSFGELKEKIDTTLMFVCYMRLQPANLLIQLLARKRISIFPKKSNYSCKDYFKSVASFPLTSRILVEQARYSNISTKARDTCTIQCSVSIGLE